MALYYYSKYRKSSAYNSVQEYVPGRQYLKSSVPYLEFRIWLRGLDLYAKREVDSNGLYFLTGPVTVVDEIYGFGFYNSGKYVGSPYIQWGSTIGTLETEGGSSGSNSKYDADITNRYEIKSVFSHYYRGSLIEGNIIAESGTYPTNGIQGDYWYVRGSIVPIGGAPTLNVPSVVVKVNENISVSWGSVSQATSYFLEKSVNGGSYSVVYSGSGRTYSEVAPKAAYITYRVRAYGNTQYTTYTTSNKVYIKTFPDMAFKIGSTLKIGDEGWVKINGQLKSIASIYIKVNGVLKEL